MPTATQTAISSQVQRGNVLRNNGDTRQAQPVVTGRAPTFIPAMQHLDPTSSQHTMAPTRMQLPIGTPPRIVEQRSSTQGTAATPAVQYERAVAVTSPIATQATATSSISQAKECTPGPAMATTETKKSTATTETKKRTATKPQKKTGKGKGTEKATSTNEKLLILNYFTDDFERYNKFKTHLNDTAERISRRIFEGTRSASAIKSQWEDMKENYTKAKERLQSTGEGQREDEDKWRSIRLSWLDDQCPWFEEMEDVLARDKTYCAPYVAELGGEKPLEIVHGEVNITRERELDTEDEDDEEESIHPPTGGAKNHSKRGATTGENAGKKTHKKQKTNPVEEVMAGVNSTQVTVTEKRLAYEKERDTLDRNAATKRDDRKHQREMKRMHLIIAHINLQTARYNAERSSRGGASAPMELQKVPEDEQVGIEETTPSSTGGTAEREV
ncbi:hypothetical protein FN846DRAFT_895423 [Sphaerosporella brunnea]|uniref:Uncharacterized protein n=1 Tax=Sphaerosporella brunnea TaxID=1250544 RepID=A0A5J5EGJ5_9PEZI|nr:hypothetical protein FN846DRAFT_895423 [Sphaerosporella brunnea]